MLLFIFVVILLALWLTSKDTGSNGPRFDESKAPLAPRSGPTSPTKRQIAENDLPRYVDKDGVVRTIRQNEDGEWQ